MRGFLLALGMFISAGCVKAIHHDEMQAAHDAEAFARLAFLCGSDKAFDLLSPAAAAAHSGAEYHELLVKMHPDGYPTSLSVTAYEPVFGQEAMNLFLEGQGGNRQYHYRIQVVGTKSKGYKVSGLFRGNGPYPTPDYHKALPNVISVSGGC